MTSRELEKAVVEQFERKVMPEGFCRRGKEQIFVRDHPLGRVSLGVGAQRYPGGIRVELHLNVRVDAIQYYFNKPRNLTPRDEENLATFGVIVGNIMKNKQDGLFVLHDVSDAEVVSEKMFQALLEHGYPYFDRFQTLKDVYDLAVEGHKLGNISLPFASERASVAMTVAKIEGYPDLKQEYELQMHFLRKRVPAERALFTKYCSEALGLNFGD